MAQVRTATTGLAVQGVMEQTERQTSSNKHATLKCGSRIFGSRSVLISFFSILALLVASVICSTVSFDRFSLCCFERLFS